MWDLTLIEWLWLAWVSGLLQFGMIGLFALVMYGLMLVFDR